VEFGDEVLVVGPLQRPRMPNGVAFCGDRLPGCRRVRAGGGALRIGDVEIRPLRWWDSRPVLPAARPERVASALQVAAASATHRGGRALERALVSRDPDGLIDSATGLLGLGPGLTPSGDDLLIGCLASLRLLGEAIGDGTAGSLVDVAAARLLIAARARTTALSVSLLRHACAGRVIEPVAGLLLAVAGPGDPTAGTRGLLEVGHSSGRALAAGVLLGGRAAVRGAS
jgi:hypothetical protein